MIKPFNNREIPSTPIHIYRNLHAKAFSIKDKKTGLVVAHVDNVVVRDCKCKVSEKGRQKVNQNKQKSVHAWLEGVFDREVEMDTSNMIEVYYDPYTLDSFINRDTGEKLEKIDLVYFSNGKAYMNPA